MSLKPRLSKVKEPYKRFLLAFEGAQTERRYFNGVNDKKQLLNIKDIIKIHVLQKSHKDLSNPLRIIEELKTTVQQNLNEDSPYHYDVVCLIVDRDPESFTEQQFEEVLAISNTEKYMLCISNPCFEFWLLLHFLDTKVDNTFLNKKLLEQTLVQKLQDAGAYKSDAKHFNKSKINFATYQNHIAKAIHNAKQYETDNKALKNNLGSSVFSILEKLQDIANP